MPRRRPRDETEPLFGEDWWREDQQLFQDSLARQATARKPAHLTGPAPPPRPRRPQSPAASYPARRVRAGRSLLRR